MSLRRSPGDRSAAGTGSGSAAAAANAELIAQRDRLTERFALMQSELGGLFYEMAIRDHVRLDVLVARAAELQRVDDDLGRVEDLLTGGRTADQI